MRVARAAAISAIAALGDSSRPIDDRTQAGRRGWL